MRVQHAGGKECARVSVCVCMCDVHVSTAIHITMCMSPYLLATPPDALNRIRVWLTPFAAVGRGWNWS
jgi:hypothetical protein